MIYEGRATPKQLDLLNKFNQSSWPKFETRPHPSGDTIVRVEGKPMEIIPLERATGIEFIRVREEPMSKRLSDRVAAKAIGQRTALGKDEDAVEREAVGYKRNGWPMAKVIELIQGEYHSWVDVGKIQKIVEKVYKEKTAKQKKDDSMVSFVEALTKLPTEDLYVMLMSTGHNVTPWKNDRAGLLAYLRTVLIQ